MHFSDFFDLLVTSPRTAQVSMWQKATWEMHRAGGDLVCLVPINVILLWHVPQAPSF